MLIDKKGAQTIFVPGDLGSVHVRSMDPDALFDMGVAHIDAARAGQTENPDVQIRWGRALLVRALVMVGVPPEEVEY